MFLIVSIFFSLTLYFGDDERFVLKKRIAHMKEYKMLASSAGVGNSSPRGPDWCHSFVPAPANTPRLLIMKPLISGIGCVELWQKLKYAHLCVPRTRIKNE